MCILVVEDDELIRLLLTEELVEAGFEVCAMENGDQAAALIEAPRTSFSLLVTDVHMPGNLDGIAVARLMRRHWPSVPIIYTTGRPDVVRQLGRLHGQEALLPKPYTLSELLRMVERLLAGRNGVPVP